MKIDKSQVPTTKQSLEFRFSPSKLSIPDRREVLHFYGFYIIFNFINVFNPLFQTYSGTFQGDLLGKWWKK